MAKSPAIIELTPDQRALIREASGQDVPALGIEAVGTGSGWLYSERGKFWLLRHFDAEAYRRARRNERPQIDLQKARFRLKIGKSRIHRWGVFAQEPIPANRDVIEYTGELINRVEAYLRTRNAKEVYVRQLDEFWNIDGALGGSGAEFINHSCDPNLRWQNLGDRVLCQSVRPIASGEELTIDYHVPAKAPKVPCRCGSPKCRGTVNVTTTWRSKSRKRNETSGVRKGMSSDKPGVD